MSDEDRPGLVLLALVVLAWLLLSAIGEVRQVYHWEAREGSDGMEFPEYGY